MDRDRLNEAKFGLGTDDESRGGPRDGPREDDRDHSRDHRDHNVQVRDMDSHK